MADPRELTLDHSIHGSFSGRRDYRILARSPGITKPEAATIEEYSNLGGTALSGTFEAPIYALYRFGERSGRWAFSRTAVGAGERGNDYLSHVLVFEPRVMTLLRGDVFLLENVFRSEKPPKPQTLDPIALDGAALEEASRRPLGSDAALSVNDAARWIPSLGHAPLMVRTGSPQEGLQLCRTLLSILPPSDREAFTFCTHYAIPRRVRFGMIAFVAEDEELVHRYFASSPRSPIPDVSEPIAPWIAALNGNVHPLYGISAVHAPRTAADTAEALRDWEEWVAADVGGFSPTQDAESSRLPVFDVAVDPRNQPLGRLRLIYAEAQYRRALARFDAALQRDEVAAVEAAVSEMRDEGLEPQLLEQFVQPIARTLAPRERLLRPALAACLALWPPREREHEIVYLRGRDTLFHGVAEAARWMVSFHRMYPKVSLELLKHWFRDWRRTAAADPESVQPHFLHEVGRLILSFHDHGGAQLVRYSLAALVSAAPASDGLGARREWLLNLFRELAPRLPEAAHRRQIAAAIVSEGLLDELQASELDDVLRIAAEDLPRLLVQAVDGTGVSSLIHARLATRCAHGLIDRDLGGAGWNHIEEPGYLTLGVTAACRVIERGAYLWDVDAGRNLAWLVWACARALRLQAASWQVGAFVEHQAATDDLAGVRKRMVWILDRLLESPPHMNADMVLRAAAFLYPDLYKPSVPDDMLISFLRQTRRDCRDSRAPLGFRMMTLTHAHALLSGERGRRMAG